MVIFSLRGKHIAFAGLPVQQAICVPTDPTGAEDGRLSAGHHLMLQC
jgi:hypothetical protein